MRKMSRDGYQDVYILPPVSFDSYERRQLADTNSAGLTLPNAYLGEYTPPGSNGVCSWPERWVSPGWKPSTSEFVPYRRYGNSRSVSRINYDLTRNPERRSPRLALNDAVLRKIIARRRRKASFSSRR